MNRRAALRSTLTGILAVLGLLGACGGGSPDGGASACPTISPVAGAPCGAQVTCEYGADPDVRCNALFTCDGGTWAAKQTTPAPACGGSNVAACPSSYASLGSSCTVAGTTCVYPEARCTCADRCGMFGSVAPDGGPPADFWCCPDAPPAPSSGCPSPRPRIGTACSQGADTACDYGACSGNVMLKCQGGAWTQSGFACPG